MAADKPQVRASFSAMSPEMRRSYRRVVVIWVIVLVALYAFQEFFS